jgi:selT/selW/selH-like putative selenoprotein
VSLAARLRSAFGVESELIAGSGGVFDVRLDDTLIYSKLEEGAFPDEEALVEKIRLRGP